MKTKLLTLLLLVGSSMFAQSRFSIQVDIGTPAYDARLHPAVTYASPACPGPGYTWVEGCWYPLGSHYDWHAGYWTRPPYLARIGWPLATPTTAIIRDIRNGVNSTGAAITTSAESPMNGTGRAIVTAEGATEITVNLLPTLKLASSLKSAFPDAITAAISNQARRVCWIGKTGVL